jgi:hypothetical protein
MQPGSVWLYPGAFHQHRSGASSMDAKLSSALFNVVNVNDKGCVTRSTSIIFKVGTEDELGLSKTLLDAAAHFNISWFKQIEANRLADLREDVVVKKYWQHSWFYCCTFCCASGCRCWRTLSPKAHSIKMG